MIERHAPKCLACNYSLTGVRDTRCPECGHPIDTSFNPTRHAYLKRATSAPSRLQLTCWAIGLTFFVISASPRGELSILLAFVVIFFALLLTWVIPVIRMLHARRWLSWRGVRRVPINRRWLAVPILLTLAGFTWSNRVVIHTQWFLSRGAFERELAAPALPATPCWIGLYRVTHITNVTPGHTQFLVDPIFGLFGASIIIIEGKTLTPSGYPFDEGLGNNWWMLWDPS